MELFPVGFDNYVAASRLVAIANPASLPVKRMVRQAQEKGMVVDLTSGRKVKAVLVMDTGHLVLATRQPDTIAGRANALAERPPAGPQEDNP